MMKLIFHINYWQLIHKFYTQVLIICKAFTNGSSANINFSNFQFEDFLVYTTGIVTNLDNFIEFPFKLLNSYEKELSDVDTKN